MATPPQRVPLHTLALIFGLRLCTHSTTPSLLCCCAGAVAPRTCEQLGAAQTQPPARQGELPARAGVASLGQQGKKPDLAKVSTWWSCWFLSR